VITIDSIEPTSTIITPSRVDVKVEGAPTLTARPSPDDMNEDYSVDKPTTTDLQEHFIINWLSYIKIVCFIATEARGNCLIFAVFFCVLGHWLISSEIETVLHMQHAKMKFRAWCSSFGPVTFVSNGTAVTYYGQYPLT
jgi:hypothetical protein